MKKQRKTLTQSELTRYLKACRDAGVEITSLEIVPGGKCVLYSKEEQPVEEENPWDRD